jgi:hypothetical protein
MDSWYKRNDRIKNFDDQAGIFLVEDDFRERPVRAALPLVAFPRMETMSRSQQQHPDCQEQRPELEL